jgi:2-keto-3-deoxy-L-rhamnonate aldolase RhmA
MTPIINTAADPEPAVQYCRYPPQGRRGFELVRAARYIYEGVESYRTEVE